MDTRAIVVREVCRQRGTAAFFQEIKNTSLRRRAGACASHVRGRPCMCACTHVRGAADRRAKSKREEIVVDSLEKESEIKDRLRTITFFLYD